MTSEGVAEAIHQALEMDLDERRKRMHRMRQHVMDHNIYRWAASILGDLRELRLESSSDNRSNPRPAGVFCANRAVGCQTDAGSWHPVTVAAAENIRTFFADFAGKVTPLLLLDCDGTLAPFRPDRFLARPWAGMRELLTRIQQQGRTRMAIISGRSAHEIRPLLGTDPPLEVWGFVRSRAPLPQW